MDPIYQLEQRAKELRRPHAWWISSAWRSNRAKSWRWSAPAGRANPPCCACSTSSKLPTAASCATQGSPPRPACPSSVRRQVTTVFQRPALLHDSVENNIGYGLRLRGQSGFDRVRCTACCERMGLDAPAPRPGAHALRRRSAAGGPGARAGPSPARPAAGRTHRQPRPLQRRPDRRGGAPDQPRAGAPPWCW